ncbi:MAG: MFS transporter [Candidatus Bathyarchaeota archaeon]|nr:MFS transporter [Candidatus Bathyarchaeota archaeon]
MVAVSIFSGFGMRIVWDFLPLYAVDIVGLTNFQLGIVQTTGGVISAALAMPGGIISDRFGRKPLILISRVMSPISMFLVTVSTTFQQYYGVQFIGSVANALGGGGIYVGGPAWNALIADLVPKEKRGTIMGTMGTLSGIVATPAAIVGGYLWDAMSPQVPFYISLVLGLIGTVIFQFGVKEPKRAKG